MMRAGQCAGAAAFSSRSRASNRVMKYGFGLGASHASIAAMVARSASSSLRQPSHPSTCAFTFAGTFSGSSSRSGAWSPFPRRCYVFRFILTTPIPAKIPCSPIPFRSLKQSLSAAPAASGTPGTAATWWPTRSASAPRRSGGNPAPGTCASAPPCAAFPGAPSRAC